jgi:hypothetical protein
MMQDRAEGEDKISACILISAYPMGAFFEDKCQVPGTRYRVPGTWDLVPGTGAGPTPRTEHRSPKTEPGHWKTRTSGLHLKS